MRSGSRTTASEAPTAVLLPGLLCDRAVWAGPLEALAPRVQCIVIASSAGMRAMGCVWVRDMVSAALLKWIAAS
jgi:hypothetical protein